MRTLPLIPAALALALAAPALAQNGPAAQEPPRPLERPPVATTGVNTPTAATMPASDWAGSHEGWGNHVTACAARYPNYDPASDMYREKRGVYRRCVIGDEPKASPPARPKGAARP